jgi:DNA-directed RNA polymerase specialized sigma24 family protein
MSIEPALHRLRIETRNARREVADGRSRQAVAVAAARAEGLTWTQIGAALGVSSQAVQQRYGKVPV